MDARRFTTILFDWGNTVMKDDPHLTAPMVTWREVEAIPGIDSVLSFLHETGREIMLATSASISDEGQIRAALARVDLDKYFDRIFCFKNTGIPKGEAFYRHILNETGANPADSVMIGDTFEQDVLAANRVGIHGIWYNPSTNQDSTGPMMATVHSMEELRSYFENLDHEDPDS